MRRVLAVFLLVVFAGLATTDTVACPDGCQAASSESTADQCNDTGICLFCTGGVVPATVPPALAPLGAQLPPPVLSIAGVPVFSIGVPDHPPRRA